MIQKIRKQFTDFFNDRGHTVVPSSSLLPDDPSVLLTTAGMQQFKRYYTGELNPQSDFGSSRTVSVQKCFRTSDIEEVGDTTHLTLFEMVGNFSFGPVGQDDPAIKGNDGYFKNSAIMWAWEFVTTILNINPERLYVTVFEGDNETPADEESRAIWRDKVGLPEHRIKNGSRKDNFWGPTGNEGPCGPTTEIYVATSAQEAEQGNGVEIWNIVFNQYVKQSDGAYTPLDNPGVDTGMGLERLLAVVEGKETIFATSAFSSIINTIDSLAPQLEDTVVRIIADHIRAVTFLISEGIEPSNKEAGYVLRRLLRRVIGLKIKHDIHAGIVEAVAQVIAKEYGVAYPEVNNVQRVIAVWQEEVGKFESAIAKGMKTLNTYKTISGEDAFYLYETFGLPFELTKELASPSAVADLSYDDFEQAFQRHQEESRAGAEKKFGGHGLVLDTGELKAATQEEMDQVIRLHTATHLLQWALRRVLGNEIRQMGSDITAQRLRFDFPLERKMTEEEKHEVETLVNQAIQKDYPVSKEEMTKEEALEEGALAFFREKYPDRVSVYTIGVNNDQISKELCGGPHVDHTGAIGTFVLLKEESVGKGVRRIRATVRQ